MPAKSSRAGLPLALFLEVWVGAAGTVAAQHGPTSPTTVANKSTEIVLPLKEGKFNHGDVPVHVATDNSITVARTVLIGALGRIFRPEALNTLDKSLPQSEYVTLRQIEDAGLPCRFDAENLEIQVSPKVEQRPRGEILGSMLTQGLQPQDVALRSFVSGYLNTHLAAEYDRNPGWGGGEMYFPAGSFDGAVRVADVVFETEFDATWAGEVVRRGTRAIYDLPDQAVRITAGDLTSSTGGPHIMPAVLGIGIEKSFQKLQPIRSIRPTGRRSFRLERHSEIEILLNDRPVRRLQLGPGEYDLDSLPLIAGNNNVQLRIKDETGREEKIDFSILFDRSLLEVGLSEWSVNGGVEANHHHQTLVYDESEPFGGAAYRLGLRENLTGELTLAAGRDVVTGGLGILLQTPLGLLALDGGASASGGGDVGWFGAAEIDVALDPNGSSNSLQFGVELESEQFVFPAAEKSTKDTRLRASGSYSRTLEETITGTLSAHYAFAGADDEDAFGLGLSLNKSLGDGISIALSGGYGSERSSNGSETLVPGLSVFGRLNYRLGQSSGLSLGIDPVRQHVATRVGTSAGNGTGSWSAEVEFVREPGTEGERSENSLEGSFGYTGNRFELTTSHGRDFTGLAGVRNVHHSATFASAVAFADGAVAVGRPIRNSFALVDLHPSLEESRLRLSPSDQGDGAISDGLGPALVSDIAAYAPTRIGYGVDDLPPGHDIGNGALDFLAPYKAGYHLKVGSGFAATVSGVLQDADGKPIKLLSGSAFEKQSPDRRVPLFTNREGYFAAEGFGAGEWVIEIGAPATTKFTFSLPADASGMIDLKILTPRAS